MKRQWSVEELVEQFTLLADETALLENKSGANCLGFAILLKFFQIEAKFPTSRTEVPQSVISYVARQLDLSPRAYRDYEWQGRTIERHRAEVREFFGFRESTRQDALELIEWLTQKVLVYDRQESHLEAAAYQRLRELKLEPPSPERVERLIRSAIHTCEESFCERILEQLSAESQLKLDALLKTEGALDENEHSQFKQSDFNILKTEERPHQSGKHSQRSSEVKAYSAVRATLNPILPCSSQDRSPLPPTGINRTATRITPSPCPNSLHIARRFLLAKEPGDY